MVRVQIGKSAVWFDSSRIGCRFILVPLSLSTRDERISRNNEIDSTSTFNVQYLDTSRLSEG